MLDKIIYDNKSGSINHVKLNWARNNTKLTIDGIAQGTDTSCDIPSNIDTISIGSLSGTQQANCVISNIKIYGRNNQ